MKRESPGEERSMAKDTVYKAQDPNEPFRFNAEVAAVFPDMLRRSIPGYAASIEAIGSLAARYVRAGTTCYDLGCSLGATSLAILKALDALSVAAEGLRITAVDNAAPMLEKARESGMGLAVRVFSQGPLS